MERLMRLARSHGARGGGGGGRVKTEEGACGKGAAQGARESAEGAEVRRVQKSVRRGEMREGGEEVVGPPRVST